MINDTICVECKHLVALSRLTYGGTVCYKSVFLKWAVCAGWRFCRRWMNWKSFSNVSENFTLVSCPNILDVTLHDVSDHIATSEQ